MNKILVGALVVVVVVLGVSRFRGRRAVSTGVPYSRITAFQAKSLMEAEDVVIVDVRTEAEFLGGHIRGAINIPVQEIGATPPGRLEDLDATILVYCRSGARSAKAARRLLGLGYTTVHDFGGINRWSDALVQ
ncbi:MAG: rhodanese-like domain-containing protein [Sphaerochaeta sp.]|jgi:rhodanese-related sulfurtransferase|nr:rhodanese-like domain-containing protein [Sphaerochaeta sp.]MDX9915202.1 rhodanese-like domain-containing protein [Sphaerochaeta sp.]